MVRMSNAQKVAYFASRKQHGDVTTISENTGYSQSHISNVLAGRRTVNKTIADGMYSVSQGRKRNSK